MKIKRLLCCIFALIMLLNLSVVPAFAEESSEDQIPAYMEEAAADLREGLKNWEQFVTVSFQVDADDFNGKKSAAKQLAQEIQALGLSHTGIPDEGDYLRFSLWHIEPSEVRFKKEDGKWNFTVEYYAVYFSDAGQEAELDGEIQRLVQELNLKGDLTDYQKISAIYNYICGTVTYDYENLEDDTYGLKWSAYAAAINKTAVCQGYATLFYRLALEAGIDNRIITGEATNANGETESHAWNTVKLDGKYYLLDSTWDSETYEFRWFLKSSADFVNHESDREYKTKEFRAAYPLAEESYAHPNVENAVEGDYEYRVIGGKAVIIRYNGTEQDVVVPATVGGYPVWWIASAAFCYNPNIVSVTFSEGIRMLEASVFMDCYSLKAIHLPSTIDFTASKEPDFQCYVVCGPTNCPNVETITVAEGNPNLVVVDNVLYTRDMTILRYYPAADPREFFEIPEGVISIGARAFGDSKNLKEVKMPDTVLRLQISCFECSSALEKISISNNCRFIDQYVFSGTALKSIYIPASVEVLKSGSFGLECQVETITVDPANPVYYVVDGVLYGHYDAKSPNVDSCHEPGAWLVKYPAGLEAAAFTIPEGIIGIEQHAFDYCANLTEIILPDSLRTISAGAFWGCTKLSKMELPENLERIYDGAFVECAGLVDLVVPASVDLLGYYLFSLHNLENLVFLGDAPEMTEQTFSLQTIKIYYPAGNTTWDAVIQMYAHESGVQWIECCETHQFVEKTREATCALTGYTGRQCSVCGLVEVTGELIPAKGHDLELFYKDTPSCEFSSWEQYQCKICQEQVSVSVSEATGHNYVDGVCVNCVANEAQDPTDPPDIQEPNEEPNIQDPTGEPDIQEPTEEPDVQDSTYPPEVTDQTQVMLLIGLLLIGGAFVVIPVMLRKKK